MTPKTAGLRVSITAWHPDIPTQTCTDNIRTVIETALAFLGNDADAFEGFRKFAFNVVAKVSPADRGEWASWWDDLTPEALRWMAKGAIDG